MPRHHGLTVQANRLFGKHGPFVPAPVSTSLSPHLDRLLALHVAGKTLTLD